MTTPLTDEGLMAKFAAWHGEEGYFTAEEFKRVLELAKAADPAAFNEASRMAINDLAAERGMSVEGLATVMKSAVNKMHNPKETKQ